MRDARTWAAAATVGVVSLGLVGCGGQTGAAPDRATAPEQAAAAAPLPGGPQATALANDVCRAVRSGAPRALPTHVTAATLARYAAAAQAPTERAAVSLQRLAAHHRVAGLDRLVSGYLELRAVYAAARTDRDAARARRLIAVREGAVSAAARSAKLPACAVGLR